MLLVCFHVSFFCAFFGRVSFADDLSLGLWRSREDARAGGTGPWHAQARAAAREMYEKIEFRTLELVVGEKAGQWEFREWKH